MTGFPDKAVMAELTAKMLLEVDAIRFMADKPFIYTSGWASPFYTDCRRLISFPRVRRTLIDFGVATVEREIGFEQFDSVAGGETAGIPFAAWMAERLMLPMQYVRKKAKGFGRNAQIEGHLEPGARVLLVEDLASDGRSKVNFCEAAAQRRRRRRACLRVFLLRYISGRKDHPGRPRHHIAFASHLVGCAGSGEEERPVRPRQAQGRRRVHERSVGLVESPWRRRAGG